MPAVVANATGLSYTCTRAASTDFEDAVGAPPQKWLSTDPLLPLKLTRLLNFEVFPRACLYCDSYVTSTSYKAQKTRDNKWISFQHHLHAYEL